MLMIQIPVSSIDFLSLPVHMFTISTQLQVILYLPLNAVIVNLPHNHDLSTLTTRSALQVVTDTKYIFILNVYNIIYV